MEVLKTLLWCCMAVIIAARKPHGTKIVSSASNSAPHEQCYCIPKSGSGVKVTDMQVPQSERLVVYLYKNVYNDVTVHIPNYEKQSVLPDLEVEKDDIFEEKVTHYTVDNLFNANMSHKLSPVDEIYAYKEHPYVPSVHHTHNIYVPTEQQESGKHQSYSKEIPLKLLSPSNNIYLPTNGDDLQSPKNGLGLNLHLMNVIKKNTDPLSWISNKPINFHLSEVTVPEEHTMAIPMEGLGTLHPTHIVNQALGQQPANHHYLTSIFSKEMNIPDHNLKNILSHDKFDQWLLTQINFLMNHKSYAKYAIDFNTLKGLLVKSLQNNGIRISNTGFLVDSKGKRINIDNLKLNPVFLGDPLEYEKRFATKGCLAPHDLPHIETVLLSSSNPPRILGIIPLASAALSSNSNLHIPICSQSNYKPGSPCHHTSLLNSGTNALFNHKILLNSVYRRKNGDDDNNLAHPVLLSDVVGKEDFSERDDGVEHKKDDTRPTGEITSVKEIGTDDDYEDLGIRVLGGQSATSSGAPINNKGRSGMP